ncbi:hypothetical protein POL68_07915 [Stigmatella sp. ncwal1]|uniref:Uncharacterized protein n=1 Tax=Stigmatella ashevillensis TaxID=2995309 RepID=A0ABT5D3Z2_9BACT|nr:hypothetical protein [Stigmatella ashevillena]MDC0708389.1 hypothetical protein [Stigmatella ashevillena]
MSGPGPQVAPDDPRMKVLRWIRPPAFFLLCVGVIAILFNIAGFLLAAFKVSPPFQPPPGQAPMVLELSLGLILTLVAGMLCGVLSIWGALSAMQLKGYGLATVGAITASFCLSPTVCIGIPITCWLLFTLSRPEVRKAFAP